MSGVARYWSRPEDSEDILAAKTIWIVTILLVIPLSGTMGAVCRLFHWPSMGMFYLAMAAFYTLLLAVFSLLRRGIETIGLLSQMHMVLAPMAFSFFRGGLLHSGGVYLLGLIGPLYALAFPRTRRAVYLLGLYLAGIATIAALQPHSAGSGWLDPSANLWLSVLTFGVTSVFAFSALLYFVAQRNQTLRRLGQEQERSEKLLLNILPVDIAERLKRENRLIADHFAGASILFADIVGFTPLSATMSPAEVVDLLNVVFTRLDEITDRYALEKIKTVGDCYMVVAGIPNPRPDHARAIVDMALDIRELVQSTEFPGHHRLQFRIGINSGSVVAGVIGKRKFIYDLWGDAVNTASRMESHGQPGIIQITRATFELVCDDFECLARSPIQVKGKGAMEVWHVLGRKDWLGERPPRTP